MQGSEVARWACTSLQRGKKRHRRIPSYNEEKEGGEAAERERTSAHCVRCEEEKGHCFSKRPDVGRCLARANPCTYEGGLRANGRLVIHSSSVCD